MSSKKASPEQSLDNYSIGSALWAVALLLLVGAAAAAGVMTLKGMGVLGESLPGCGPQSACDAITNGPFGSIPGLNWPVSFLGFAWFTGLIVAWSACLGGVPQGLKWLVRIGVVFSLMFLVVMVVEGALCPYCLTTHLCNIAFWGLVELSPNKEDQPTSPALVVWLASFAVVSLFLGLGDAHRISIQAEVHQEAANQNMQEMQEAQAAPEFTGRYLMGPEDAAVKIVMFTDYQCPDCNRFERQIQNIMNRRDDVSLSIKHNPFNTDCNPYVPMTRHSMACAAAQAAEAAGILGGEEAFWQWHEFLMMNKGEFEPGKRQQRLPSLVEEMGFDRQNFMQVMASQAVQDLITEDVEEAQELGIFFTPMIFINGVQWKWAIPGAPGLNTVVDQVAEAVAAGQQKSGPRQPDTKAQKIVADWRDSVVERENISPAGLRMNDVPGAVRVTVYGDYASDVTKRLLDDLEQATADTGVPISLSLRVYPFEHACNSRLPQRFEDRAGSCLAAHAAKAAALAGGEAAHKAVHDYALANQAHLGQMDEGDWAAIAAGQGANPAEFIELLSSEEVEVMVQDDINEYRRLRHRHLPTLRVEQKIMPRWQMDGEPVIQRVLEEAAQTKAAQD
ncbi:MAG: thioredoxin domain-containing protein [Phycisphaerales bacterium]|nr:thioredoxin domain-containing protein [Phycisphaerales bacterium]